MIIEDLPLYDDKQMFQSGGKKIGEGGYGCVYNPAINCDGTADISRKYVSKLQINGFAAKNEVYVGKLVKKITDYSSRFVPIKSHCFVNKTRLKKNGIIDDCKPLKYRRNKNIVLMKMNNINGMEFNDVIESMQDPDKIFDIIKKSHHYLMKSVNILLKHHIVHYDLKSPNIMYDKDRNIPLILDFGLSIPLKILKRREIQLYDYFYTYSPEYYLWCPEIHMLSFIAEKKYITKTDIENICRESLKHNIIIKGTLTDEAYDQHKQSTIDFYKNIWRLKKKSLRDFTHYLLKTYKTWDKYSISIMFLNIIVVLDRQKSMENKILEYKLKLLKYVHYNPYKRNEL